MDHVAYLIKEAVNVARLAQIARANQIPLIGDWRYVAKLLHKAQRATPAGKTHYSKVLGFLESHERESIKRLRDQVLASPQRWRELHAETLLRFARPKEVNKVIEELVESNPKRKTSLFPRLQDWLFRRRIAKGKMTSSELGNLWEPLARRIEYGVVPKTPTRNSVAVGLPGVVPMPYTSLDKRQIHTHPGSLLREGFEEVLPSAPLNRALRRPEYDLFGGWTGYTKPTGLTISDEIASLKRQSKEIAAGRLKGEGDLSHLFNPGVSVPNWRQSVIFAPHAGTESVSKMLKGQLKRLYFRKGQHIEPPWR